MSTVADNAVVADDLISNGHPVYDGVKFFEPSKLVTDGEVVEAAPNGVQDLIPGAEDVFGTDDKTDDSLVTEFPGNTLAAETSVEVLNVGKLIDDVSSEAPILHTGNSDKENTTFIHDSEPLANGHHKSLFVEESEQLTTLTIAPCNKPASLTELVQEDAIEFSDTVISEIPKDESPITDSAGPEIPFVDVATIVVEASKASLDCYGEPPIAASTGPDTSLSDFVTTSINGVGSTATAEPSCQDETPISQLSTEIRTADLFEEVVVPPAIEAKEISTMAVESEPAIMEDACDPIDAEASITEAEASPVGEEPAVTETVALASIDSIAETAPEGETISNEQESALVETQPSTAESGATPTTLQAAPITPTLCEVVLEESQACEPSSEPAATLEPILKATELQPVEDAAVTAALVTEVAELDPIEETVLVSEAVATVAPAEISGAEAEESAAEGAVDAEDAPAALNEPEVEVFVPEVVSAPAEVVTGPDVLSTESEDGAITPTMVPEVPVESVVAAEAESAHDSITADSEPVTTPDPEPIATSETDFSAAAGREPAAVESGAPAAVDAELTEPAVESIVVETVEVDVESETPAAVDAELTEPAVESIVVETVEIDVEPPSSNVSFIEDPEVGFMHADDTQTVLAEGAPVFEEPVSNATDVESEVQVEEFFVEEIVEVIPINVATPIGEPASLEEIAAEEVVAVEDVTDEEFSVEEPLAVEKAEDVIAVEETIPAEEVVLVDVATGELAALEETVLVEETTAVEETIPTEEVVPVDVATGEPATIEETLLVEETTAVVPTEEVVPVDVATGESATLEETVLVEETAAVEETLPTEEVVPVDVATGESATVEENIPAEEVVPVDVATGEPAPVGEVPSVEAVAIEEHAPVGEITPVESASPVEEPVVDEAEPTVQGLVASIDDGPVLEEAVPSTHNAVDVEASPPTCEVSPLEGPAASFEEPLVVPEETFAETAASAIEEISLAGDASAVEETSSPFVKASVGEDVPAVEERSALVAVDMPGSETVEELSASVEEQTSVAAEDTMGCKDEPVAIEETSADAVKPVSVDGRIPPTIEGTSLLAEVPSDADGPTPEATSTAEETYVPEGESVTISEVAVVASVEEDVLVVEEPLELLDVEASEPVVNEAATVSTREHELIVENPPVSDDQHVAVEETPAAIEDGSVSFDDQLPPINEIPLIAEVPSVADEPTLDDSPSTEEPPAPEDEPITGSVEVSPTAGEVAAEPEEITSKAEETTPVYEAGPTTSADPILDDALSPEGTTIVAEQSTVESDASIIELPVAVETPAPAASEAAVVVEVVLEEVHAFLEHTEDALCTSEETEDRPEGSPHVGAPVCLPEQPFVEESLHVASIVEEFAPVPAEESEILEELDVVTSQVLVNVEPLETSSEIEETEAVEYSETTAVEDVTEQQEIATSPALNLATDIERPKSPWSPSYSVMTQGPGVPVEEHVTAYEGDDDAAPAQSQTPEIIIDEVDAVVSEVGADMEVSEFQIEVLQVAEEQVALGELEEPHPKSPWTPSYSVTVQGNVAQTNEELDNLEQLPPSAARLVAAEEFEEQPVPFTEALISGEVTSSTTVVADIYATLSATLDKSDIPDSAAEADAFQNVASEQGVIAQAEPSVQTPPEPPTAQEVAEEEIEQGSFIVDDESTQLGATDPDEERSSSPWTASYSVTGLEPAPALEDQATANDDEFVEHGSFIIETQPTVGVEDTPEVKSDSGLLTPVDDPVGERPKSPWTPSYSVTKQGSNDAVEEEELDEIEHIPGPLSSIPALSAHEEPIPPVFITETRAFVDEPLMAETPSLSEGDVTVSELSESYDDVEASGGPIARETPQTFPVLEEPQKITNKKPSLSAVDELNATEITESSILRIDIPTNNGANRSRLESTTSSRFFPGGWFSSSPKVPEEGRTSLDVAAGEFIHKSSVENTPTSAPTTALPSAVEEDTEKKSRWCTIM
ncbi:uncharacterized protein EDB93DRAFT_1173961 [Suillus bovinus]|uniref:uncharacterized protein n=1 Tax=Suillus bovinus TaxID=48563 RepID=UPI001B872F8A|nr:uncharacterized protein EDB93DRAFT_1173961 [Suillus bovinus]KAG2133654.1 hypothetical protein EDB93DRAFT_1173961 [Suillus bovinus]